MEGQAGGDVRGGWVLLGRGWLAEDGRRGGRRAGGGAGADAGTGVGSVHAVSSGVGGGRRRGGASGQKAPHGQWALQGHSAHRLRGNRCTFTRRWCARAAERGTGSNGHVGRQSRTWDGGREWRRDRLDGGRGCAGTVDGAPLLAKTRTRQTALEVAPEAGAPGCGGKSGN